MKISWHKKLSRRLRSRLRKSVLARFGIGVCAETENGLFIVDPGDFVVSRHLLQRGKYDTAEIEWLLRVGGGRFSTVVVVGVHVGAVLVPLARKSDRVIGFESNPATYKLAKLNLLLNEASNVTLENCAIGQRQGVVSVVQNAINTGNASISIEATDSGGPRVNMVSLDEYGGADAPAAVDLLLMDIEGHEFHALRGAERTLKNTTNLYVEYAPEQLREHGTNPADLIDFLLERFSHMYLYDGRARGFTAAEAKEYLKSLPERKGLLLNLLFRRSELAAAAC